MLDMLPTHPEGTNILIYLFISYYSQTHEYLDNSAKIELAIHSWLGMMLLFDDIRDLWGVVQNVCT